MRCDELADLLAGLDGAPLDRRAADHVARCLRCQADAAQYRRIRRGLAQLAATTFDPGPLVLGAIFARLDADPLRTGWTTRRLAYLGGIAAATAGAAGALMLSTRARRRG